MEIKFFEKEEVKIDNKNYSVYVHINKINSKCYVGLTSQKPTDRWGPKASNYTPSQVFSKAIKKYGWDNFDHIVLETGLSCEEASEKEKFYIEYYNSLIPNGYNCAVGGYNYNVSDFSRDNMSKVKGVPVICLETKEVFNSASKAGKKYGVNGNSITRVLNKSYYTCVGYHWMKYADYLKNGIITNYSPNRKQVICIETKQVFNTAHEAAIKLNLDYTAICKCCNKKIQTHKNLHWAYYEEYLATNGNVNFKQHKNTGKKIRCIETGEVFNSMREASRTLHVSYNYLKRACEDNTKTAKNKHWEFL